MVEDVVGIEARNACLDAAEGSSVEPSDVDVLAQSGIAYLVVVACAPVEEVYAYLRRIEAHDELLFQVAQADVGQLEGVACEYPAPAEVRSHLQLHVGREGDRLRIVANAAQYVEVIVLRGLQHHREIIMLGLYVGRIYPVEAADDAFHLMIAIIKFLRQTLHHRVHRLYGADSEG